jgi:hypothetical protein
MDFMGEVPFATCPLDVALSFARFDLLPSIVTILLKTAMN